MVSCRQKLEVQGEKSPVILCTYFSRKIFSEKIAGTKVKDCSPEKLPVLKKAPMSLAVKFNLTDAGEKYSSTDEVSVHEFLLFL